MKLMKEKAEQLLQRCEVVVITSVNEEGYPRPSQTTHQAVSAQLRVRPQTAKGPYFKDGSTKAGAPASKPPAYPTHRMTKVNAGLTMLEKDASPTDDTFRKISTASL